jgi:hypothetical protein
MEVISQEDMNLDVITVSTQSLRWFCLVVDKRHHATIHAATKISVEKREMETFISVATWLVPQP